MAITKRVVISRDDDNNVDLIENPANPVFDEFSIEFENFELKMVNPEMEDEDEEEIVIVYLFYPEGIFVAILPNDKVVTSV